jgi:hypothetical protein
MCPFEWNECRDVVVSVWASDPQRERKDDGSHGRVAAMNRSLRLADINLSRRSGQTVGVNEGEEINPRKIRAGMMMIGAVTVVALVLFLAINDPTARIVFAFVFVAGLIQTWRLRRRGRDSLE